MREILIICAMDEEIERFKAEFTLNKQTVSANFQYYEVSSRNYHLRLAKCGIGKVQMALTATYLISQCRPDLVINTGSAGAVAPNVQQRDCIVATGAFYHDVDMTAFDYQLGQLAGHDLVFKTAPQVTQQLFLIAQEQFGSRAKTGLVATGDAFVSTKALKDRIYTKFPQPLCAEMEGAALAQVATEFNLPFAEIRGISDDEPDESAKQFDDTVDDAGLIAANVALAYLATLEDNVH